MVLTVEQLAGSAVRFIESFARQVERLSTGLVFFVAVPAVINLVLAALFLRGGALVAVVLLLAIVAGVGLAAALLARGRFRAVTRRVPQLANELHELLISDPAARQAIDTYIVDDPHGERFVADLDSTGSTDSAGNPGVLGSARSLLRVRRFVGSNMDRFTTVTAAVSAAKVGPWLVFAAGAVAVYLTTTATMMVLVTLLSLAF